MRIMRNTILHNDTHDTLTMPLQAQQQPATARETCPPVAEAILRLVHNDAQTRSERRHSRSSSRASFDSFNLDDPEPALATAHQQHPSLLGPAPPWPPMPAMTPPSSPPSSFSFNSPERQHLQKAHRRRPSIDAAHGQVHVRQPSDPFDLVLPILPPNPNVAAELPYPLTNGPTANGDRKWNLPLTPRKRPSSRGSSVGWQPLTLSPSSSLGPASPVGSMIGDAELGFTLPNLSTLALPPPGASTSPNGSVRSNVEGHGAPFNMRFTGGGSANSSLHGHGGRLFNTNSSSANSSLHGHGRLSFDGFSTAPMSSLQSSMSSMSSNAKCFSRATGASSRAGGRPSLDLTTSGFGRSRSPTHSGAINATVNEFGRLSLNGVVGNGSLGMGDIFAANHSRSHSQRGSVSSFDAARSLPFGGVNSPEFVPQKNALAMAEERQCSPVSPTISNGASTGADSSAFKTCIFCDTELHEGISLHNKLRHPFACQICRTDIATQRELDDHNIAVHGRNVPCTDCGRAFAKHHHLAQHMRDAHKYPCPRCNKIANSRAAFEAHVKDKHPHLAGRVTPVALPVPAQNGAPGPAPQLSKPVMVDAGALKAPHPNAGILPTMNAVLGRLRGTKRGGAGKRRV
ncbi:hypothetical protein AURDEDRAFT_143705 [Auricularia subglabra TFB-10046 SS5]|nr:hypothetical protein AURDEDRAFT_143705 [Auricularia subglabra TFB-10046 SS5]